MLFLLSCRKKKKPAAHVGSLLREINRRVKRSWTAAELEEPMDTRVGSIKAELASDMHYSSCVFCKTFAQGAGFWADAAFASDLTHAVHKVIPLPVRVQAVQWETSTEVSFTDAFVHSSLQHFHAHFTRRSAPCIKISPTPCCLCLTLGENSSDWRRHTLRLERRRVHCIWKALQSQMCHWRKRWAEI